MARWASRSGHHLLRETQPPHHVFGVLRSTPAMYSGLPCCQWGTNHPWAPIIPGIPWQEPQPSLVISAAPPASVSTGAGGGLCCRRPSRQGSSARGEQRSPSHSEIRRDVESEENREPHRVDEMPVDGADRHGRVTLAVEVTQRDQTRRPASMSKPDHHMHHVEAGDRVVERAVGAGGRRKGFPAHSSSCMAMKTTPSTMPPRKAERECQRRPLRAPRSPHQTTTLLSSRITVSGPRG